MLVDEALAHLDQRRFGVAQQRLDEAVQVDPGSAPVHTARIDSAQGLLLSARGQVQPARQALQRAVSANPADAEAHYALARLGEQQGDHDAMVKHDLRVLALDRAEDRRTGRGGTEDLRRVQRVVADVLDSLPPEFAQRLGHVPVVLEPRPSAAEVRDGQDPRLLGLMEGHNAAEARGSDGWADRPTRIVVYYANLAACCDDHALDDEVAITVLHEIGHYLGLDEDGVTALGLA